MIDDADESVAKSRQRKQNKHNRRIFERASYRTGGVVMALRLALFAMVCSSTIVSLCAAEPAAPTKVDQAKLREKLTAKMADLRVPGAIVAVYRGDETIAELALGKADVERDLPITADMHFRVASVSKPCVGTVILQLVDEGKIALDDPIADYVPDVPGGDKITLRHLGTMRAGLFNYIESKQVKAMFAAEPERIWKTDELLSASFKGKTYFEPGKGFHYANTNTLLLGKVIEKVTGNTVEAEVERRICKPLGLTHTKLATDNAIPAPHPRGYSWGTDAGPFFNRGTKLIDVTAVSPSWWGCAGSMISTVGDLRKLAKPMAVGSLIKPATQEQRVKWEKMDDIWPGRYGFCLEIDDGIGIGHDGDVPGFQCTMRYLPEHDATVIVLTNIYGWSVHFNPSTPIAEAACVECGFLDGKKVKKLEVPDEG
ncbi:MAG: serine hydrolase domain-containing protein [Pirellulales bacterium]